jgi:hypothetical protein
MQQQQTNVTSEARGFLFVPLETEVHCLITFSWFSLRFLVVLRGVIASVKHTSRSYQTFRLEANQPSKRLNECLQQ